MEQVHKIHIPFILAVALPALPLRSWTQGKNDRLIVQRTQA